MAEPNLIPFHRKLAAILAADVVGYSGLMEADEVGTLRQVRRVQSTCIDPITAAHGGRLIKSTGDGFLFEFASAHDAILFALAFQKKLLATMEPVPKPKRLAFRIGVHAGDILSSGTDVFGNGVNIAARLETLCTPGGICMSDVVHQQVQRSIELAALDRGEHQVKNIARPVRVYEIGPDAVESASPIEPEPAPQAPARRFRRLVLGGTAALCLAAVLGIGASELPRLIQQARDSKKAEPFSIAVLPFTSLSDDGKPDSFADALVDNLTTDLSIGFPSSTVISSASTFTYRGKSVDPRQAARELGARYLLTGSVQKTADRLRVSTHLIDGATGGQLWSDEFDGSLAELNTLRDQITTGIANTTEQQLVLIEADRQKYTTNANALDLTFRAIARTTSDVTPDTSKAAESELRQALVLDPDNPLAMEVLAGLLIGRVGAAVARGDATPQAPLDEAQKLLGRVRSQNPRFPGLHNELGFLSLLFDEPDEAIEHYRTEIQDDPSAATAFAGLGMCLIKIGQAQEAIPLIEKSIRLNPRSPGISAYYEVLALAYFAVGKYADVIAQAERAYSANPNDAETLFYLAAANAYMGNQDEARSRLAEARKLDPTRTLSRMRRSIRAKEPANIALANRYIEGLRRAGLPDS